MSALRKHKSLIALAIAVIVIAILAIVNFTGGEGFTFANSLWAILPPVVAIGLALITKEVYSSLFVGILIGALMSANFNFAGTMDAIINDGLIASVSDTAGIFIFLVILGVIGYYRIRRYRRFSTRCKQRGRLRQPVLISYP